MATQNQAGKRAQARKSGPSRPAGSGARAGGPTAGRTRADGQGATSDARPGGSTLASGTARSGTAKLGSPARAGGRKLELTTLVASVLGLAASIYLTIDHFTSATSLTGCPENATINCLKVTTSPQSHIFGIPVAVLGLAFFVFMVPINSPWGWRARQPLVHWARLASVVVGMALVLYLIYAELFLIDAICLYCTFVHLMTFILFSLVVARVTFSGVNPAPAGR